MSPISLLHGLRPMKIKSKIIHYLCAACFIIVVMSITACTQAPEPALRIGTNTWPGYEPLYLARSLGYYKKTQVNLIEMTSASEVIHALRSGTLEGATLTLDEALTLLADGIELKIILVMDFSNGGDVLLAKPSIETLSNLRGKRIAVEYTAVGAILLDAALATAGLTVSDIEVVSCLLDNHINCYNSNDAVVTFDPVRTKLLTQGAKLLFDSSKIAGRIVDILVVHDKTIQTHTHSLENLLAGYFKARKYLATQPDDAAEHMALRQDIAAAEVLASYDGLKLPSLEENHSLLKGTDPKLQSTAENLVEYMLARQLLRKKLNVNDIISAQFLPHSLPQ